MAEIPLILVVAVLAGALLNVVRGVIGEPSFDYRLFAGSLITASLAAVTAASVLDIAGVTDPIGLIILGLITGFGTDVSISRLKKPRK